MPDAHKNFAYSTIATPPSPADTGTSLVVLAGDGAKFPTPPFNVTVWPTADQPLTTNAEIVRVTAISGDTFTIVRTQEGTTARAILVGDQIAATITVKTLTDIEAAGWTKLFDSTLSADSDASITISVDASKHPCLWLWVWRKATGSANGLVARFNGDAGANYDYQLLIISASSVLGSRTDRATFMRLEEDMNAGSWSHISAHFQILQQGGVFPGVNTVARQRKMTFDILTVLEAWCHWRNSTNAITSITLLPFAGGGPPAGNAAGSRFVLWGGPTP